MVAVGFIGFLILIGIIAGIVAYKKRNDRDKEVKQIATGISVAGIVIAILIYCFASFNSVSARAVGIITEFGKPVGTVDSGPHWLNPWSDVTEFPTTNQSLDLDATDGNGESVSVKFAGGLTGVANLNINWQAKDDESAVKLWNQWKEFDKVGDKVVKPRAQTITSNVIGSYDPIEAVKSQNNTKISKQILDDLNKDLESSGVVIEAVNVKGVNPDQALQDRINREAAANQNIDIARKEQDRALIDEQTNKSKQVSLSPGGLQAKCLEITNAWDQAKNGPLPANWNCNGQSGNIGLAVPVR